MLPNLKSLNIWGSGDSTYGAPCIISVFSRTKQTLNLAWKRLCTIFKTINVFTLVIIISNFVYSYSVILYSPEALGSIAQIVKTLLLIKIKEKKHILFNRYNLYLKIKNMELRRSLVKRGLGGKQLESLIFKISRYKFYGDFINCILHWQSFPN